MTTASPIPEHLREFDDTAKTRNLIYSNMLSAVQSRFPVEDDNYRLELKNVRYTGPQTYTLAQQKDALLKDRNLHTAMAGTWRLIHKPTNKVVEEREDVVMHVPYYTDRGTIINRSNEYTTSAQARLLPGVYTRRQRTGEIEAQFNVSPETGKSFRIHLEPKTGVFKINVGQSSIPAYPLFSAMGITDKQLMEMWGPELLEANMRANQTNALAKLYSRFAGYKADSAADDAAKARFLRDALPKFELDENVNGRTLGLAHKGVTPEVLLRSTQKMLHVSRNEAEPDDRDALQFARVLGIEDLMRERVDKDAGKLAMNLFRKVKRAQGLKPVQRGVLDGYVHNFLLGSGLSQPLEETNVLSTLEQLNRITKMGEGGIGSEQAITDEARDVNPSHIGFIDPVAGPEGGTIGVDVRTAYRTFKGTDQRIYGEFRNPRTGKLEYLRPDQVADATVAYPGEMAKGTQTVRAVRSGKQVEVPIKEVDYEIPSLGHMFSSHVNMNPMPTGVQGGRQFYAAKFWSQFLPQVKGELPLVDSLMADGKTTYSEYYGRRHGTLSAQVDGKVTRVDDKGVTITDKNGTKHLIETVKDFPFNRLSGISFFPTVKVGDAVRTGDMVAHSNFTDAKTGAINMGQNLKTVVLPLRGASFEDAQTISESAARRLATERLHGFDIEAKHGVTMGHGKFISAFPRLYTKDQLANIDADGIIKPGTVVNKGDPILLAVGPKLLTAEDAQLGKLHKVLRNAFTDRSQVWEYTHPGIVTDAVRTRDGARVNIKSTPPVAPGDKLVSSFGLKGVVSRVVPDDEMPRDPATNEPYEMVFNPATVLSRVAPNQIIELALAKVAKKTGKQIRLPQLPPKEGWAKWAQQQLDEAGVSDVTDVFDPQSGKTIKNVGDGYIYTHAFHHLAEKKLSHRGDVGGYDLNQQAAKGGSSGGKRFSSLDVTAALSHSALGVIKDVQTIRGTKNEEYWKALKLGKPIPEPGVPFIYDKFLNTLKAGGINLSEEGDITRLLPMTDDDVDKLSHGTITRSDMVDDDFEPIKDGLFDVGKTGGASGKHWTAYELPEPIPNPVMEEPVRRLLGLKVKQLEDIIAGREQLNGKTGGLAIKEALSRIDIDEELDRQKQRVRTLRGAARDNAIKCIGYLAAAKEQGVHPAKWVIGKVPILPPTFRPVARMGDMALTADLNELYRDVIEAGAALSDLRKDLPDSELASERLNLYGAVKAAYGLGEAITPEGQSKRLKGAIRQVIGDSPKCYDSATELLTRNGWIPFGDVDGTVDAGTMNPYTGKFEWQRPTAVLHQDYNGVMVRTLTKKLDLLVTPNHYHYVEPRVGKYGQGSLTGEAQWPRFEKVYAAHLVATTSRVRFLSAAQTPQDGPAPAVECSNGAITDKEAFATFLGLWIAEGWHSSEHQIAICQSYVANAANCEWIEAVMRAIGLPYERRTYDDLYWWVINDTKLQQWVFNNFGSGARGKYISAAVLDWDSKYLRKLVEGYMRGDGEKRACNADPSTNWTFYNRDRMTNYGNRASTVSRKLVDCMAELCVRIGLGFRETDTITHEDNPNQATQYRFRVDGWNRVITEYPGTHVWEDYVGKVHCVTVPNGLLIVRRNGRTAISSNSGLAQSKVFSKTVDVVGRGVVTPDPNLNMDQIGIPEDSAWTLYKDFVMRKLVQRGFPAVRAAEMIGLRTGQAKEVLEEVMADRPVIVDRAPTWHKFNLLAFYPHIVEGHTVRVSPLVTRGFTMDFDGNCVDYNTVVQMKMLKSTLDMMCTQGYSVRIDTNKETRYSMRADKDSVVEMVCRAGETEAYAVLKIGQFPKMGEPVKDKNGADVYAVPAGVEILSYDVRTGKHVYRPVTSFTEERDVESCRVTVGAMSVVVSDNESLSCFNHASEDGSFIKTKPADALGALCVTQIKDPMPFGTYGSRDLGWWIGAFLSDGWLTGHTVGYSKIEPAKRDKFIAAARECITDNFTYNTYTGSKTESGKLGDSVKIHCTGKYLAEAVEKLGFYAERLGDQAGRAALYKRIPDAMLVDGSEEFLWGLLSGLLDGDGSIVKNMAKAKPRFAARLATSSCALRDSMCMLARRLGIRYNVTTTRFNDGIRSDAYTVTLSTVDMFKSLDKLSVVGEAEQRVLTEWKQNPPDDSKTSGIIPLTLGEAAVLARAARSISNNAAYGAILKDKVRPRVSRYHLEALRTAIPAELYDRLATRHGNSLTEWQPVESVEPVGKRTVYDFAVEGTKVFVADGIVVWDTVNFHVPASDKAVEDTKTKMLPSANLFSLTDLHSVRHSPSMEMTYGLYALTRKPKSDAPVRRFRTVKEAEQAYRDGQIKATDPIEVLELT